MLRPEAHVYIALLDREFGDYEECNSDPSMRGITLDEGCKDKGRTANANARVSRTKNWLFLCISFMIILICWTLTSIYIVHFP